mgnify:CR=1 FL=1
MNTQALISTLPIMAKGMAGIFIVTGVIILCMMILGKVFNNQE